MTGYYVVPLAITALSLVVGAHLTVIGASLIGVSLMAVGIAFPMLAVLIRNYEEEYYEEE